MLPVVAWVLGGAILGGLAGAAVGAAWDFLFMTDEDTTAAADWLRENNHPTLLSAFTFLVKARKRVRRQFGIRVSCDPDHVQIVREESFAFEDLPPDVQEAIRDDEITLDVTDELQHALAL